MARHHKAVWCQLSRVSAIQEIQIQKEQQKVDWLISNFDPIDEDLPGLRGLRVNVWAYSSLILRRI